ncbi:MAG TPA: glutaredoxin family protein [Casimicrobiaceae bacterium]|nr:glutaredoxin family protein [Casimicrobiaceae bacterium]
MARSPIATLSVVVIAALASGALAQPLYRYVDPNGRVVYSDQPPPATAKDAQMKQLPQNVIETDPVPLQAREAAEHFPVTLYTFDCDICRDAQALLVKRGIPFETVVVSEEKGAARLKALTGKQTAPVLAIGDKQVLQGYNETLWQARLDDAGYPRTAPAARRAPATAGAAAAPRTAPDDAAAPAAAGEPARPAPGQGYPK